MSPLRSLLVVGIAGLLGLTPVGTAGALGAQGSGAPAQTEVVASAASTALAAQAPVATPAASSASAQPRLSDPIPAPIRPGDIGVGLRTVATGLVSPVAGAVAPGIKNRLFVADQVGKIWSVNIGPGPGRKTLFADLTGLVVRLGDVMPGSSYDERGLLGLAFSPDYAENGLVYTYLTEPWRQPADFSTQPGLQHNCDAWLPFSPRPCQNVVTEWHVRDPHDPNTTIDMASQRDLIRIDKPQFNHNGGALAFGPDGLLYISVGDGGFANDVAPGHVPGGNAQSLAPGNVLGKILRIDPRGHNSANGQYGIPRDNPYVGRPGADEIFAYGFRNPYRMSFDKTTGQLWVGDVGQNDIEEVDIVRAGGNYGWHVKEGTFTFNPGVGLDPNGGFVSANSPGMPAGLIDPVAEYDHTAPSGSIEQGEAIVGGFVYRGSSVPALAGKYVFGDYSRVFGQPQGRLFYMCPSPDVTHRVCNLLEDPDMAVFGFAQDAAGELYVLGNRTGVVSGDTGVVERLTAAPTPFLDTLPTQTQIASTLPANQDINPYGIAIVHRSSGKLVRGDVLISNFNAASNLQGTGTTVVEIAPNGKVSQFAEVSPADVAGRCPGGVGLTTALVVLRSGWVIVGSLPTSDGSAATAKAGCLIVLDRWGNVAETIHGGPINGPWDMTAVEGRDGATLFVTNVLNGTVAAAGKVVDRGTVVRIRLSIEEDQLPRVRSEKIIGSGFPERTDPNALVIGPTGLAMAGNETLYVADTLDNRIAAIPDAFDRHSRDGTGRTVSSGGALNEPLGLTLAPNGDILTVNAADGDAVETTPGGLQTTSRTLDGIGAGTLFGLAVAPGGEGVYFVDDGTNTLQLLH
jgi:glucose/arabinose dehydrogenase